jgi:uncharacterized RDD family membrane protein YckC
MPTESSPAPLVPRALAALLDLGLLLVATGALSALPAIALLACLVPDACYSERLSLSIIVFVLLAIVMCVFVSPIYLVVGWSRGATLGMRANGLRLTAVDGSRPGIGRALLRALVALPILGTVALITPVGPLAAVPAVVAMAALRRDRRGPHDLVAGTYMIRRGL